MELLSPTRLSQLPRGVRARFIDVEADTPLRRRLAELGLTAGQEVTVVQVTGSAVVVALRGGRTALSRSVADHVMVREASE